MLEKAIIFIAGTTNAAYKDALRARKDKLKHHPDEEVRAVYHALVTQEDEPEIREKEQDLRAASEGGGVAHLFDAAFDYVRNNDREALDTCLKLLRGYQEQEVAQAALAWARNGDPVRRLTAARALERPSDQDPPSAYAIEAIRVLAADTDTDVVLGALDSFRELTHFGPYQSHQIAPVRHCETHPNAAVREKYAGLFSRPGSTVGLPILTRLSGDPSGDVRLSAARALQEAIVHMEDDPAGRAAMGAVLAGLLADGLDSVRLRAIQGLAEISDPRAVDAIVTELERDETEVHARLLLVKHLAFLMVTIIRHPDRRYLSGLRRWLYLHPTQGVEMAIEACTTGRPFPML